METTSMSKDYDAFYESLDSFSDPGNATEAPATAQDFQSSLKINPWLYFEDEDEQALFSSFLEARTSKTITSAVTFLSAIYFMFFAVEGLVRNPLSLLTIFRVLRACSTGFCWLYIYIDYHRPVEVLPGALKHIPAVSLSAVANQAIFWYAIFGGSIMLIRTINGHCEEDQNSWVCNSSTDGSGLPTESVLVNVTSLLFLPLVFKAHSFVVAVVAYMIALSFFIASFVVTGPQHDAIAVIAIFVVLLLVLYDYERSIIHVYCDQRLQECIHQNAKPRDGSAAEQKNLSRILGNVAHDLKTPLQLFMSEIGNLESLLGPYFFRSSIHMTKNENKTSLELKNILFSLKSMYSFMMMAINRGLDFRKSMAGISLMPQQETFHIANAIHWAVSRFDADSMEVVVRVHTPQDNKNTCQMIIMQDQGVGISAETRAILFEPFKQAKRRAGGTGLGLFSISKRMEALGGHCGVQGRDDGTQGSCFWLAYPYVPDWESATEADTASIERSSGSALNGGTSNSDISPLKLEGISALDEITKETSPRVEITTDKDKDTYKSPREPEPEDAMADNLVVALLNFPKSHIAHLPAPLDDPFWRRVLLVDDSVLIIKAVTRLLRKEGFDVDVARNGAIGLELMKEHRYLFVLTDIQMPVMDGNEMIKRLRQLEAINALNGSLMYRQLVFGMSANSDTDTENKALESGMDRFIVKPVSRSSLKNYLYSEYLSVSETKRIAYFNSTLCSTSSLDTPVTLPQRSENSEIMKLATSSHSLSSLGDTSRVVVPRR